MLRRSSRAVLWRETRPGNLAAILFVQWCLNQCGVKEIGARAQFDGAKRRAGEGAGVKKGSDQACNDRQTQKNPRWMDSLLGEHLHKN